MAKSGIIKAVESCEEIKNIWPNIGLACYRGSIAHGTAGDITDDIDIGGVFIAPKKHYFGLTRLDHIDRVDVLGEYDFCLYEISKYFRLLLKSNPNVISWLWMPHNLYFINTKWSEKIITNRHIFMSKQLYKSFGGYAYAQLQRMTKCCTKQAFQGQKRRERFEKFGYDCKNAAHLIRLLRTGIEALLTGEINVVRHDAKQLKEIKYGNWTLGQVEEEADRLQKILDESLLKSQLPNKPDFHMAEQLLVSILEEEVVV